MALAALAQADDRMRAPPGAEVYIIAPRDGAVVHGPVTIKFGLKGMGVAPAGVKFENTGHHHLLVDMDLRSSESQRAAARHRQGRALRQGSDRNHADACAGQAYASAVVRRLRPQVLRSAAAFAKNHHHRELDAPHGARDPARRHGCVLRIRGGARSTRAQGQAAHRRRARAAGAWWRRPTTPCGDSVCARPCPCDEALRALPARRLRAAADGALQGSLGSGVRDIPRIHPAGGGTVAGRGISGRHREPALLGERGAIGADIRRRIRAATGADRLGRDRAQQAARRSSPPSLPSPMVCTASDPENVHEVLDALPIERLLGVGRKTCRRAWPPASTRSETLRRAGEPVLWRALRQAGQIDAAPARQASTSARSRPIARKNRSAPRRPSPSISGMPRRARAASDCDSPTAPPRACGPSDLAAGRVTVKIRRADFTTYTRQCALEPPTQDTAASCRPRRGICCRAGWRAQSRCRSCDCWASASVICGRSRQADLFETAPRQELAPRCGRRRHPRPLRNRCADPGQPPAASARNSGPRRG